MRKLFRSSAGMSLVEVMIAASILGGLALTTTKITQNMDKSSKGNEANNEYLTLFSDMRAWLSDNTNGTATFLNMNVAACTATTEPNTGTSCAITSIKDGYNTGANSWGNGVGIRWQIGSFAKGGTSGSGGGGYKSAGGLVEVDSAWVSGWVATTTTSGNFTLNVRFENLGYLKRSTGAQYYTKQIAMHATVSGGLVTEAAAAQSGSGTQWLDIMPTYEGIYYGNGGVLVGSSGTVFDGPALNVGVNNTASGNKSVVFGSNSTASNSNTFVVGESVSATQAGGVVLADASGTAKSNTTTNSFLGRFYNGYSFFTDPALSPSLYVNAATGAATGLVGINTSSPQAGLHIVTTGAPRGLRISGTASTSYTEMQFAGDGREFRLGVGGSADTYGVPNKFYIYDQTGGGTRMTIDTSGNVGIGTMSPGALLDLYQSSNGILNSRIKNDNTGATAETRVTIDNGTVYSGLELYGSGYGGGYANYLNLFNSGAYPITFSTSGNERMRVHGNGNVGIGSTNPLYKFVVNSQGNTGTTSTALHGQYFGPTISSEQTSSGYYALNITNGATANTPGSGSSIFYVRTDGNVGIGTASPSSPLHITRGGQTIQLGTGTNTSGYALNIGVNDDGVNISNNSTGRNFNFMTANQAAPAAYITSHGMVNALNTLRVNGFDVCWSNGCNLRVSDKRFKEKIVPLGPTLEKIMKVNPITYEWKDKKRFGKERQIGFVAQEIEKIFPETVMTNKENGMKSVDYGALTAPIINALKEIYEQVTGLFKTSENRDQEIEKLKELLKEEQRKNEEMSKRMDHLEQMLENKKKK